MIFRSPEFDRAAGPLGGRAVLKCRATGVPNVEFSWGIEGDGQMIARNTSKYKFFDYQIDHSTFQVFKKNFCILKRFISLEYVNYFKFG